MNKNFLFTFPVLLTLVCSSCIHNYKKEKKEKNTNTDTTKKKGSTKIVIILVLLICLIDGISTADYFIFFSTCSSIVTASFKILSLPRVAFLK